MDENRIDRLIDLILQARSDDYMRRQKTDCTGVYVHEATIQKN